MPFILVSDTQELLKLVDELESREDREPVMVLVVDHEAAEVLGAKLAEQPESRVVYVVSRTTADPLLPRLLALAVAQGVLTEVVSRTAATPVHSLATCDCQQNGPRPIAVKVFFDTTLHYKAFLPLKGHQWNLLMFC